MSHSSNKKMKLEDHIIEDSDSDALVIDEGSDFERDRLNVNEEDSDSDRLVIDEDRDCYDDPTFKRNMFGRPLRPTEAEEKETRFEVKQMEKHEHYAKNMPIMNPDLAPSENIGKSSGIDCSSSSEGERSRESKRYKFQRKREF